MISQSQALSWKNFWSLTFPSYNTKYSNHIRSIMINSALIPHGVLLWWQRKTWKSVAHPSDLFFSNNNGFQVLMCHHAVRKDTRWPATNSSACNELRMRQRDRMQWVTAADTPSCGQKRHTHTRWPATNSSACNESRLRQRDRVQWITAADTPSCGQKRHTRWPATNAKCWLAIVRSEKTHTLTCNEFRLVMWPHTLTCNEFRLVMWLRTVRDAPTDFRVEGF